MGQRRSVTWQLRDNIKILVDLWKKLRHSFANLKCYKQIFGIFSRQKTTLDIFKMCPVYKISEIWLTSFRFRQNMKKKCFHSFFNFIFNNLFIKLKHYIICVEFFTKHYFLHYPTPPTWNIIKDYPTPPTWNIIKDY